ncbi:DNA alkylation repair protein [Planktotalea sp.]|uniref:DNA alkylation repair protein n=1 Tax=Planktotalea sp. TaxID=2029877 RepID=UPI0032982BB3
MEPFKNLISPEIVRLIGVLIAKQLPEFNAARFQSKVLAELDQLEMKERVALIADTLHAALPKAGHERLPVLLTTLHPDTESKDVQSSEDGLSSWGIWPLTHLIGTYGLDDFEASLAALKEMTKRHTSEFDVRPFIVADQARALGIICAWADDPSHHVRRLVSEGTRPRLPWGVQLKELVADPTPMIPTLKKLRDDPSEYVRRSVANHLNDIAKDHPNLVADLSVDWLKDASKEREKLVRHACRTLIKQGHEGALSAFGLHPPEIEEPKITLAADALNFGGEIEFDVSVTSVGQGAQTLVIDYVIHFLKANGTLAPKVFKWTKLDLKAGESKQLSRRHGIKPITTRKYYDGQQVLSLRINGKDFGEAPFELKGAT